MQVVVAGYSPFIHVTNKGSRIMQVSTAEYIIFPRNQKLVGIKQINLTTHVTLQKIK